MKNIITGLKIIGQVVLMAVIVIVILSIFLGTLTLGGYLWQTGQYIWAIPYTYLLLVIIAYFVGKYINN